MYNFSGTTYMKKLTLNYDQWQTIYKNKTVCFISSESQEDFKLNLNTIAKCVFETSCSRHSHVGVKK